MTSASGTGGDLYVGGAWLASTGRQRIDVVDPTTEAVLGSVAECTRHDVDHAVRSAADAFPSWAARRPRERAELLASAQRALAERADDLAEIVVREVGMPRTLARRIQVGLPIETFRLAAEFAAKQESEEIGNSLVLGEPYGVVAAITPWNYPLHQIAAKVAYAIGAGCTVVLKPSEIAPGVSFALAQIFDEVGGPPGVFNLVTGRGPTVGETLVQHERVDMVSFTGSVEAGQRVAALASVPLKKVTLELGGKSASIACADADLSTAVKATVADCFLNSGQTCSALTRLLVPREVVSVVTEMAVAAAARYVPGDPRDAATRLGPLVSERQRERVRGYITRALAEGATLACGGPEAPVGLEKGFFVQPTVLANVRPDAEVAQAEVFGPVLSIIGYADDDEAVAIANGTRYGLAGAVWSNDPERALRVARRLRCGQVAVNGGPFNLAAPFGGYGQSGVGRENGVHGFREYQQWKAIQR